MERRLRPEGLRGVRRLAYRALHLANRGEVLQPRVAVFMLGLPGSGKSRVIAYRYELSWNRRKRRHSTVVLDLDAEIAQHPEYDPADPDRVYLAGDQRAYLWADARVESRFHESVADPSVKRLVVDGTGTNLERQVRRMNEAREAGLYVKALYVRVPVKTAIARAAMRKRGVSPQRIRTYQDRMAAALRVAGLHADEVETVDVTFDDAPLPGTMNGYVDPITSIVGYSSS